MYGQLAIIMSTAGIFSALLTARSSEAVTRFFTREILNQNFENAKFILYIGFLIDFITALLLLFVTYFFSDFIASTFIKDVQNSSEVFLYSFVVFFGFLRGTLFGYFQSKEMFFQINFISLFESFIKILAFIFVIFVLKETSLRELIYIFMFTSVISYLYTLIVFLKKYTIQFQSINYIYNKVILKEYWSFNLKTFISSSLKAGNQNIDNLIIAYFLNAQLVGIYQVIKKILSPLLIIASPFSSLIYPKLIHYFETNQKERFRKIIVKTSLYILIISMIYGFVMNFCYEFLLDYMRVTYLPEYHLYYLLLLVLIILNSQMWWVRAFSNTVNPNYSIYMNIFATLFQLTFTVVLSKYFGLEGMLSSMIFMNLAILLFWFQKGYKYVYTYIHIQ